MAEFKSYYSKRVKAAVDLGAKEAAIEEILYDLSDKLGLEDPSVELSSGRKTGHTPEIMFCSIKAASGADVAGLYLRTHPEKGLEIKISSSIYKDDYLEETIAETLRTDNLLM